MVIAPTFNIGSMGDVVPFLVTVVSGLERIAAVEIHDLLGRNGVVSSGRVILPATHRAEAYKLMKEGRSMEKLYILLHEEVKYNDERELHENSLAALTATTASQWLHFFSFWKYMDNEYPIRYRVTAKMRGKHKITEKTQFSKFIAGILSDQFDSFKSGENLFDSLQDDLVDWNMEILVHLSKNRLWMGINLTPQPLWQLRSYQSKNISFGSTSLKPTISYAMIRLLDIKRGFVLEPMVGSGMIVLELMDMDTFSGICMCGDNASVAIQKTNQNINRISKSGKMCCELLAWDATRLPFPDNSVDGIITDLPFGKRIANESKVGWDYPNLFREFFRILCKKSKLVLLSSNFVLINRIIQKDRRWINQNQIRINHGGIECVIFVLAKRYIPHNINEINVE